LNINNTVAPIPGLVADEVAAERGSARPGKKRKTIPLSIIASMNRKVRPEFFGEVPMGDKFRRALSFRVASLRL
jgi:hypothetical protein